MIDYSHKCVKVCEVRIRKKELQIYIYIYIYIYIKEEKTVTGWSSNKKIHEKT